MPSSPNDELSPGPCSGRLLFALRDEGSWALFLSLLLSAAALASAQTNKIPAVKKATAARANEFTLAGLRPGKDTLARASLLNKEFGTGKPLPGDQTIWYDRCRDLSLTVDSDKQKQIEVIRAAAWGASTADCAGGPPSPWKTGLGLRIWDHTTKLAQLYGDADSKSPSTRGGQPLELWYYAFDWAGPDVPQVMEVLCTREKDGQPGRVVEITLAAPSL
jgi:hypothetical protein